MDNQLNFKLATMSQEAKERDQRTMETLKELRALFIRLNGKADKPVRKDEAITISTDPDNNPLIDHLDRPDEG